MKSIAAGTGSDELARKLAAPFRDLGRSRVEELLIGVVPYLILAILIAWLGLLTPASLSGEQLSLTIDQSLVLVLVAVGQTIVLLSGGIDLSVGGVISVTSAVAATHLTSEGRVIWVSLLLLALGWLPGAINGVLIVVFDLQPFIVTLGTWFICAGVAFYVLPIAGGEIDPTMASLTNGAVLGVDNAIWIFLGVGLVGIWFLRTRIGLEIRALGADGRAARLAGIRVNRALIATYAASSMFAVAGGIVLSAQSLSGDPTIGDKFILSSVAAAVIGGTSLLGGSATVVGTMAGALVLGYVARVTFAQALPSEWGLIFTGLLLALAVAIQGIVRALVRRRS